MKKSLLLVIMLAGFAFSLSAQQKLPFDLMPYPESVEVKEGKFRLEKEFTLAVTGNPHERIYSGATRFLRRLDGRTGLFFPQDFITKNSVEKNAAFVINVERPGKVELHEDESYELSISTGKVTLSAPTDIGALRGLETLLQLLHADEAGYYFPAVVVRDQPRFPWRGLMIDGARHFMPVDVLKRNLDGMAAMKMNVFHWHLTEDQGFRIESKVFPKLHELGSDGMYYTQKEIREIIAYADERGIRVYPELDIPGHATSWLVGHPELGSAPGPYTIERYFGIFDPSIDPTKESTYEFLDKLFEEVASLFPDPYFHIGGDENTGKHWLENPDIVAFMKEKNFKDPHDLQAYFNNRLLKILEKYNKKMVGWDEILQPGISKDIVIQSWRGKASLYSSAKDGYQGILSNGYYIDLMHPASEHYTNDPIPDGTDLDEKARANIFGGEATMWSELVTPLTVDSRIWPRTAAIAERFWSPSSIKNVDEMYRRLPIIAQQMEELHLTHIKNQDVILRNLCKGYDIAALKTLVRVVEPLKGYRRNLHGKYYTSFSPFTLFADAATADAPDARTFNKLADDYIMGKLEVKDELIRWLQLWKDNHVEIQKLVAISPVLKEIESLSENLSNISDLGLKAVNGNYPSEKQDRKSEYEQSLTAINKARDQGGRTQLMVVDAIEKIVKGDAAVLGAKHTPTAPKIDGDLSDWNTDWNYFLPVNHYNWNDTCYFAMKWDEKNFYIAYKVKNANLQARAAKRDQQGLHEDDGIEFLIDANYDKSAIWMEDDIAYHVNVKNIILDEKGNDNKGEYNRDWNGKAKTAVKVFGTINQPGDRDQGYHVEVAIPWKELGITPEKGASMGINVCVNDRDDTTGEYRYYDYMNLKFFHYPEGFAEVVLEE